MRRRSPLMGFTEAELGFIIAAVVAATATMSNAEASPPEIPLVDSAVVVVDSVTPALTVDSTSVKQGKRDELPYCSQLGLAVSPIAPITILGATRYSVNGERLDATALKGRLASAMSRSAEQQCKYKL